MLEVTCPDCGKTYHPKPELAGKKVKCKCGGVLRVPDDEDDAPPDQVFDIAPTAEEKQQQERVRKAQKAGKCPACSAQLDSGAVLCVHCGYNLQTGKRMNTMIQSDKPGAAAKPKPAKKPLKPSQPGKAATAAPSQRMGVTRTLGGVSNKAYADEDKAKLKNLLLAVVGVLIIVGGAVGALKFLGGDATEQQANMHFDDKDMAELLREPGTEEAMTWLNTGPPGRMVGGWNKGQAENRVKWFTDNGAKRVMAFGGMYSTSLGVELPDDPAQRQIIFDWQAKHHEELKEVIRTDQGQKWLKIRAPM